MIDQEQGGLMNSQSPSSMLQVQYFKERSIEETEPEINGTSEKLSKIFTKVEKELVNYKKNHLIERIKTIVIELVYYSEKQIKINFSNYLSEKLDYNYTHMANLFSKVHGTSIQTFIIATKIERVKELLIYEGLTVSEISYKLHYSSAAHLSGQFKKVTGMSPSQFIASTVKSHNVLHHTFLAPSKTNSTSIKSESVIVPLNSAKEKSENETGLKQMEA